MAGYFEAAAGGGAAIALEELEISILRSFTVQFLELIGPGPSEWADPDDPLVALLAEGPSEPPADPALARLFPDAYGDPDKPDDADSEAASAEFRRYTENDLRTRKRNDALAVVRSLDAASSGGAGGAVLRLDQTQAHQWLGTLNDLRLTIGSRLGVTEDNDDLYHLPEEDPRKPMVIAYLWLGELQTTLIDALM